MSTVQITQTGIPNETGAIPAFFTISRDNTSGNITVFFEISGTARQNIDYDIQGVRTVENTVPTVTFDGAKGSVVIPDKQTSVDIKIVPRDDILTDTGETVTLTLTEEPTGAPQQYDVSSTNNTATLTITDNTNPSSKVVGANERIISTNAYFAQSVFAADVDGDGDLDVLSASAGDDKIALYLNDGSNYFTEQTISNNADSASSVFAADVDGDGDLDVLSASAGDDKIALYLNDGSNDFTEKTISNNADGASSVFAADVDGDGDVDVLSASSDDDKIALYLNDGSNNFTEQTISTNASFALSVFAADVDGDGDVDVLSASWKDDKIALYLNDGSNNFTEQTISNNADGAQSVFATDVDGDGDVDVLSASVIDDKIALYLNDGSNNFTEQTISNNADGAKSVFATDVDGDGDVDILSASRWDDQIAMYETVSTVSLPTVSINATGTPTEALANPGTFTIDRGADTAGDITVFFDISGNAQQNIDYDIQGVRTVENTVPTVTFDGEKGSVVIPDGETSVDIKISPRDDVVADAGETVTLTLTEEPTGAPQQYDVSSTPGDETATLTITDNTNPSSKVVGANEIIISTSASGAFSVFAADVDGDGDVDVLSA